MIDLDAIALDAAQQIECLPNNLPEAQRTARIQLLVLAALHRWKSAVQPSGGAGAMPEALLEIQQSVQDISDRAYEAGDAPKALGDIVGICGPIIDKLSILAAADGPQAQETPREREALELLHRAFQHAKLPPKLEGDIGKFLGAVTRPERGGMHPEQQRIADELNNRQTKK